MKIYLDLCCWQRPFDDRSQSRVAVEAEAILGILALFESNGITLVVSEVLEFVLGRRPDAERNVSIEAFLTRAHQLVALDDIIESRAKILEASGFKPIDALHVASAEAASVDVFCTCDDRLLKKGRKQPDLKLRF